MNIILFDSKVNQIPLSDNRAKHIIDILKLKIGDSFKMGVINESEGLATITNISDSCIGISYQEECKPTLHPVTLIVAQVRPICMKRILRDAVSIGCQRIILCGSDTGEKSYLSSNLYKTDEYKEYLLDGAMQSAHAGLSEVCFAKNVDEAVKIANTYAPKAEKILLDNVKPNGNLSDVKCSSAVLAIGPERGWSDRERNIFANNFYSSLLLGSRVLRTETAVCCGLSVLLSAMNLM